MTPADPFAAAKVDEVIDVCTDITGIVSPTMREQDPEKKAAMRATLALEGLPKWFGYLEALLARNGSNGFFVGDELTIADIAVWRLMGWLTGGALDGVPKTVRFQVVAGIQWYCVLHSLSWCCGAGRGAVPGARRRGC
jgi:glutathione S-transferase